MADQNKDNKSKDDILYTRSKDFIDLLRKEASEAKSCVTQYSFQSLVISGAALSFIVSSSKNDPRSIATIAAIPMIIILMVMMRIAVYKYEIANRAYGYELYLKTMLNISGENLLNTSVSKKSLFKKDIKYWKFIIEREDWERTYLVWKIVYPTLFAFYYHIDFYDKVANFLNTEAYKLKEDHLKLIEKKDKRSTWLLGNREFDKNTLRSVQNKKNPADFHAGGYLTKILDVILTMQFFLSMPLFFSFSNLIKDLLYNLNESKNISISNYELLAWIVGIFIAITSSIWMIFATASYGTSIDVTLEFCMKSCVNWIKKRVKWAGIATIVSVVIIVAAIQLHQSLPVEWKMVISLINASAGIIFTIYFFCIMTIRIKRREKILETGINSIKASSLIWSIVFKVHHDAWDSAEKDSRIYKGTLFDFEEKYKNNVFDEVDKIIKRYFPEKDFPVFYGQNNNKP